VDAVRGVPEVHGGRGVVKQLDDSHVHWVAEVGGERREWDAEIVEQKPDRVVAWRSTGGVPNSGRVQFEPVNGGTRISVEIEYKTDGAKETIGSALGFDEGQVEDDLERFRDLVEERHAPTGTWRGTVESGEVVDDSSR
jgi:uncharacterized membrane protein